MTRPVLVTGVVPHHPVEKHPRAFRLSWTILRPGFLAQNLAGAYRTDICADDRLYLPAGRGRVAYYVRDHRRVWMRA
jgi:uncharacterized protein YbjT (DUF2867 family)